MFCCRSASRLPTNIEKPAMRLSASASDGTTSAWTWMKKRKSTAKTAPFEAVATKRRDRRGRALVDVGRPQVKRHERELEADAGDDEREAGEPDGPCVPAGRSRSARPCGAKSSVPSSA